VTNVKKSVIKCFVYVYAVQFNAQHIQCGNLLKEDNTKSVKINVDHGFQFFQNQMKVIPAPNLTSSKIYI
jgi:hypothetical protein